MARQQANRETAKAPPTGAVLLLPVVPHVGETDTDTLTEIPGRPAVAEEDKKEAEEKEEEVEDEFGYSWSEFMFCLLRNGSNYTAYSAIKDSF